MAWKHKQALAAALVVAACGGGETKVENPTPDDARARFDALESRLLKSSYLELTARVEATGAVAASLEGSLIIDGDRVLLGFEGTFAGKPVSVALQSDGATMTGGNGTLSFEVETPPALKQGLILGITRMGILHNLAVLSSGNPPAGTYGEPDTWAATDVTAEDHVLRFGLLVSDTPSADVALTLNTETGLPAKREQVTRFPDGTMNVVEDYESFSAR